jgi:hypothetical protein
MGIDMTRSLAVFAFSVGLLTSYAASAQINAPAATNPGAPAAAPATAAPDDKVASNTDNALICRYENVAGTRFTKRICHTQRQWKQKERDAYDLLDRLDSGKDQTIFQ